MNRDDRTKFLRLIEEQRPDLLTDVETEAITDEQIMSLLSQAMTPPPTPAASAVALGGPVPDEVPRARLEGLLATQTPKLRYQDHVREEVEEGGTTHTVWRTVWRELTADDILSSRDAGTAVMVTTKDGRKYSLPTA
jgi:hypothetical protein